MATDLFGFEESLRVGLGVNLETRERNNPPLTHVIAPAVRYMYHRECVVQCMFP